MEASSGKRSAKQWSVLDGPSFDVDLHIPSQAVLDFALRPESYSSPEAKLRVAAGGILIGILDLLHPELLASTAEANQEIAKMQQEAGKSIMYSSRLSLKQKEEIFNTYKGLALEEPAAVSALRQLRKQGLDSEVAELAEWGVMVMAINEAVPDAKLPTPIIEKVR